MQVQVGNILADVVFKDIKHVHLSVHPPSGRVTVAAPRRMELETIRLFSLSKLAWIKQQQRELREQEREGARDYVSGESHYLWGRRYLLQVKESMTPANIELAASRIKLNIPQTWHKNRREAFVEAWLRNEIRRELLRLLDHWQGVLGVQANRAFVQHMKTKWGSCNPKTGNIRINTELARKPKECLEYIVVHELIHLIESKHGERFVKLMDASLPDWRRLRGRLNQLPVRHEEWVY
jgi:predicted metal-dependent hydrolase